MIIRTVTNWFLGRKEALPPPAVTEAHEATEQVRRAANRIKPTEDAWRGVHRALDDMTKAVKGDGK